MLVEEVEDLGDDLGLRPRVGVLPAGHRQPRGVDAFRFRVIDHRLAGVEHHRRVHVAVHDQDRDRLQLLVRKGRIVERRGARRNRRPALRELRADVPDGAAARRIAHQIDTVWIRVVFLRHEIGDVKHVHLGACKVIRGRRRRSCATAATSAAAGWSLSAAPAPSRTARSIRRRPWRSRDTR